MWKFIRPSGGRGGGGAQVGEPRLRAVRAALDLKPTSKIGFPYKPSALAYDRVSQLLAVGTGGGEVYVFGAPGVEFVINHQPSDQEHSFLSTSKSIRKIIFLNAETKNFNAAASEETGSEFDRSSGVRASTRHAASAGLKPRLITLCEDDTLYLWLLETTKDGKPRAKRLKTASLSRDRVTGGGGAANDGRKEHTSMCTTFVADEVHGLLLVGTERGQLLELSLQDFAHVRTISSNDIARACPDLPRGSLGAIENIVQHPKYTDLCLVAYSRGLVVVYNVKSRQVVCFGLVRATELEDACWCTLTGVPISSSTYAGGAGDFVDADAAGGAAAAEAHAFITSHNDGSYQLWDLAANNVDLAKSGAASAAVMLRDGPKNTPFGPFPCKAITRTAWLGHHFQSPRASNYASSQHRDRQQQQRIESVMMFSGGMQNNGPYSDQHTVSVVRNKGSGREEHVCFDCTSRVVDFLPITIVRQPPAAEKSTSIRSASADKVRAGAGAGDAGRDNARGTHYAGFSLNRRDSGGVNAVRSSTRSRPSNPPASVAPTPTLEMFVAILLEEELVIIDLNRDVKRWADLTNPYLVPIHSSAITCYQLYDNVSSRVWRVLDNAYRTQQQPHSHDSAAGRGKQQNLSPVDKNNPDTWSTVEQAWPVRGGICLNRTDRNLQRCLLITGHEDGNLRLWDVGGVVLRLLLCVKTACYYTESDDENVDAGFANSHLNSIQHGGREGAQLNDLSDERDDSLTNMEEEIAEDWPVRKLGRFDPFSDDPRFCIKRVVMCVDKGVITAAGTAGQVLVFKLNADAVEVVASSASGSTINRLNVESLVIDAHILTDDDRFTWKGHKPLTLRSRVTLPAPTSAVACCRLASVVQLHPPAACSALAVEPRWGLLAVGTAHGMALIDYVRRAPILIHCTLSSMGTDLATGSDTVMSRRKSFKKSLRESFRRMRRGRSSLRASHAMAVSGQRGAGASGGGNNESGGMMPGVRSSVKHTKMVNELEARLPMERQVESRVQVVRTDDDGGMSSVVRTLKFVYANLMNSQILVPTLWLGTNNGTIGAFTILVPQAGEGAGGAEQRVTSVLCREIQLRHHAPVVGIEVVDSHTGTPMNEILKYYNKRMDAPSLVLPSDIQRLQLVIVSEEQLKAFSLPQLRPYGKFKLTTYDGALIRRAQLCQVVLETQPRASPSSAGAQQLTARSDSKQQNRLRGGGAQPVDHDAGEAMAPTPEIVDEQWCLSLLTNLGDIRVLTVPSFQPIVQWQMIAREDLVAISGLQFTMATGRGIYQCAASQFQRFSLFAPSSHLVNGADSSFGLVRCALNNSPSSNSPSHTTASITAGGVSKLSSNSAAGNKPSPSMYNNHGGGDSGSSTPVEDIGVSRTGGNDADYNIRSSQRKTHVKMVLENGAGNSSSMERVSNASSCETLTNAPVTAAPSTRSETAGVKVAAKTGMEEHHGYVSNKLSAESGLGSSMSSGSSGERQLSLTAANRGVEINGVPTSSTVMQSSSSRARKSHRETAIN